MAIKIDTGIPFECILKTIETEEIDLVIMSNKGRGNLSRVLFGSVAERYSGILRFPWSVSEIKTNSKGEIIIYEHT